jgi:hypothetical protein
MLFQRILEPKSAVISPQGKGDGPCGAGSVAVLLHEAQDGLDALLDLVAAVEVNLQVAANGIRDVLLPEVERVIELSQHEGLLLRLRVKQRDRLDVTACHAKDVIRLLHHRAREHPAALTGDVDAQLSERADRVGAGGLAVDGPNPGRDDAVAAASLYRMPEQAFRHGATADVSGADKQDGFGARQADLR